MKNSWWIAGAQILFISEVIEALTFLYLINDNYKCHDELSIMGRI